MHKKRIYKEDIIVDKKGKLGYLSATRSLPISSTEILEEFIEQTEGRDCYNVTHEHKQRTQDSNY